MKTLLLVTIFAVALLAISFAGIAIKIIVKKNGEFKRHCASIDPYTGKKNGCICGKISSKGCHNKEHSPLEVNKELLNECGSDN